LHRGDPRLERFVHALSQWPLRWRATVIVGTADGRPQEVFRVSDPSIWPLVAAVGVVVIFMAELFHLRAAALLGAAVIVGAVIRWNWPVPAPMQVEEEEAFEREYGVPVNAHGSVVVATWGTGMAILFASIAFASLLLAYFYLRLENPVWPPAGTLNPPLPRTLVAAALIVTSGLAVRAALHRVGVGNQGGFIRGLAVALLLAVAAGVLQWVDIASLDYHGTVHAYGSIFFTVAGFVSAVALAAVIALAMTLYWAVRGMYTRDRHAPITNVARFWAAMVVMWVTGFGTLYLGPVLT
jgi:cytochrome c oxidase subunit I+III